MKRENWQELMTWMDVGSWQGAKQGAVLASYYALIAPLIYVVALNHPQRWSTNISLWILMSGFGMIIGVIPAIALGRFNGAMIGMGLWTYHISPYRWNRLAVGIGTGLVISGMLNQIVWHIFMPDWFPYFFFLGIPSLIYLGACAWLSDQFPVFVHQRKQAWEYPVLPTELKETGKEG